MTIWTAVLVASVGCLALKILGWAVPGRVLDNERVRRTVVLVPVALLAALVVVQAFARGHTLHLDARAVGLAVAAVAIVLRAPFLLVVVVAAVATALARAVT
jgi:branched-subunit amino acid transport protein